MDNLPALPGLAVVALLLLLNAIFVATEFAFVTTRRTRIEQLAAEGNVPARRVRKALRNLDYYVAASQLGITMASIALGFVGEPVLAHLIEPPVEALAGAFAPAIAHAVAIGVAFALITALHIVLGQFVPKTIALQKPDGTAMALALPIEIFTRIFGPAIWLLNQTGNVLLSLLGMRIEPLGDKPLAAEDLALTLESSASAGLISRPELEIARRAIQVSSVPARELMVPRSEMVAIPVEAGREEVLEVLADHRHTRYPVYEERIDNIVGVLDAKDLLLDDTREAPSLRAYIRPPVVLPESVPAVQALAEAQAARAQLVVLADEYGGTAGIVSIFDMVEYMAGEFPDEYETPEDELRRNPDGSITMDGLARLTELEQRLGFGFPEVHAETMGGLVTTLLGRIPSPGDEARLDGYIARVEQMDGRRVGRVRLIPGGGDGQALALADPEDELDGW